jgi:hypothetical protein
MTCALSLFLKELTMAIPAHNKLQIVSDTAAGRSMTEFQATKQESRGVSRWDSESTSSTSIDTAPEQGAPKQPSRRNSLTRSSVNERSYALPQQMPFRNDSFNSFTSQDDSASCMSCRMSPPRRPMRRQSLDTVNCEDAIKQIERKLSTDSMETMQSLKLEHARGSKIPDSKKNKNNNITARTA